MNYYRDIHPIFEAICKTLRLISYGSEKSGHFLKLENESNSPVFEESNFEEREKKKEGKKKRRRKKRKEKKKYIVSE